MWCGFTIYILSVQLFPAIKKLEITMVQQALCFRNLVIEQGKPACLPRFCCNWFLHTNDIDNDINPYIYLSVWKVMRKGEIGFANVARRCQSSYTEFHSRSISICIYYYLFYLLTCSNQSYPGASSQTRLIKSACQFFSFFLIPFMHHQLLAGIDSVIISLLSVSLFPLYRAGSKQEKDG